MKTHNGTQYRAKEFAAKAGVTVRTLHFYDRKGLLKPALRTGSGYRLYGDAELERLEHIVALRFVGFGLEHIRELLEGPAKPLVVALRMQREIIVQQKRQLESAIAAIEQAERALDADESADRWKTLRDVMEVFKMRNDWSWTENYYTDEDRVKLAKRMEDTPKEVVERGRRDWANLIAEVEEAAKLEDPGSERARALADRWQGLVNQFTRGDAGITKGLNNLWSDTTHWPKDFKRPWSDQADAFIKKAMGCTASGDSP
ncbi:MAG TPA: MerR family transcriptional regulator [Candidatus Baltobacteraceae bacterium]